MKTAWLIDESTVLSEAEALEATRRTFGFDKLNEPPLNVALHDVLIDNTHQWFGRADIRLDVLVVTPAPTEDQLFQTSTFSFSGVKDGQRLPIDHATGLGAYTGWPQYFIDLAVVVSRGGQGQKTLAELMAESAAQLGDLLGNVAGLTSAAPYAAAITGAAAGAAKLSSFILRMLDAATGKSIGLYRATWYEHRHRFGLGLHPDDGGHFRQQDFEFRYEIFQDMTSGG